MAISSQAPQECGEGSTTSAWSPERAVEHHERAAVRSEYQRQYRAKHREKLRMGKRAWYAANRERLLLAKKEYTRRVSASVIERRRIQRQNDPRRMAKHNHNGSLRRAAETRATPAWADISIIESIYLVAQLLSKTTGIKYSVDHIFPLRGRLVCGLHIPDNLRLLPFYDNARKNNFETDEIV